MKIKIDGETWRVWFLHRPELQFGHGDQNATTIAYLARELAVAEEEESVISGGARCSLKDVYSRAKGRKVALARALKYARFTKAQRQQVWQGLFAQGMKP